MGITVSRFHSMTTRNRANYDELRLDSALFGPSRRGICFLTFWNAVPVVMNLATMGAMSMAVFAPEVGC
jgi:hypothetical protein